MSLGEIIHCSKNEKHNTVIILLFFTFDIDCKITKELQIKARNNDGEKPANQTNKIIEKGFAKNINLCFFIFLPTITTNPENKDKCIPDKAKMCESPAFLKAVVVSGDVYSFAPHIKANKSPPASPQLYINLFK